MMKWDEGYTQTRSSVYSRILKLGGNIFFGGGSRCIDFFAK